MHSTVPEIILKHFEAFQQCNRSFLSDMAGEAHWQSRQSPGARGVDGVVATNFYRQCPFWHEKNTLIRQRILSENTLGDHLPPFCFLSDFFTRVPFTSFTPTVLKRVVLALSDVKNSEFNLKGRAKAGNIQMANSVKG